MKCFQKLVPLVGKKITISTLMNELNNMSIFAMFENGSLVLTKFKLFSQYKVGEISYRRLGNIGSDKGNDIIIDSIVITNKRQTKSSIAVLTEEKVVISEVRKDK